MELSGPKIKKVLIFSLKKAFLIFQEMELSSLSLIKFKRELSEFTK